MTLAPRVRGKRIRQTSRRIVREFYEGTRQISSEPVRPEYFDDDTLEAVRRLFAADDNGNAPVTITVPGKEPLTPSETIAENVKQVIASPATRAHYEIGTIEGNLDTITKHGGDSVHVWETLTNIKVECEVTPEQLEQAKALLGRRVAVAGRIRYRSRKPVRIEVESIKPLREKRELPQPATFGKLDITGGMSSEAYVRGWRDGQ